MNYWKRLGIAAIGLLIPWITGSVFQTWIGFIVGLGVGYLAMVLTQGNPYKTNEKRFHWENLKRPRKDPINFVIFWGTVFLHIALQVYLSTFDNLWINVILGGCIAPIHIVLSLVLVLERPPKEPEKVRIYHPKRSKNPHSHNGSGWSFD